MSDPCSGLTCKQITAFLLEYVEGTLPPDQRAVFEQHTRACRDCQVFLDNYRKVIEAGRDIRESCTAPLVPRALVDAIVSAVCGKKR